MKTKALSEPKQRKAFRNKYLAAVLAVAALLISSVVTAQTTDSLKYSQINGYGFKYKRMAFDSTLMIPLSTSPHAPYRMGALRYRASDSTLQLWTGHQWISILTGVGNGVDTAYAFDDSTLAIETPNEDFFVKIKGKPSATQLNDSTFIVGDDTITIHGTGGSSGITQLTGDVTAGPGSGSQAATISNNAITNAKLAQAAALTVKGNPTNSTANVQDIAAATDNQVLRRSGTSIGFGAVNLASSNAVTGVLPAGNTDTSVLATHTYVDGSSGGELNKGVPFNSNSIFLGNSITYGYDVITTTHKSWPYYLKDYLNLSAINNLAISGIGARRGYKQFATNFNPNSAAPLGTMMGFNNVRGTTDTAHQFEEVRAAHRATAALQFLKQETIQFYTMGNAGSVNPNVSTSNSCGTCNASSEDSLLEYGSRTYWYRHNDASNTSSNYWKKSSITANETVTISNVEGTGIVVGTWAAASQWSRIEVRVDGVLKTTYNPNNRLANIWADGFINSGVCNDAIVVYGLRDTLHTVQLKFLDGGAMGGWDYVAGIKAASTCLPIPVYVLDLPHMNSTGYSYPGGEVTEAQLDSCTMSRIRDLQYYFPGYPIVRVNENAPGYYDPLDPTQIQSDGIHPTTIGQWNIARAVIGAIGVKWLNAGSSTDNLQAVTGRGATTNIPLYLSGYQTSSLNFRAGNMGIQSAAANQSLFYSNAVFDGTNFRYLENGPAMLFYINNVGYFEVKNATSGSAGAVITWKGGLTLTPSGDIWLGNEITNSVNGAGAALQINSNSHTVWPNIASIGPASALSTFRPFMVWANGSQPGFALYNSSGGTNQKLWDWTTDGGVLYHRMANDAYGATTDWMTVTRSGYTSANVSFPSGNVAVTGNVTVADDAYDATSWNGSTQVPTKNAIRDKIESMGGGITTINSQTGTSQTISAGPGLSVSSSSDVHTVSFNNTLDVQVTDANNVGTSATDLYSKTVAANQFTLNGQSIHFEIAGTNNDATATVNLEVLFAGSSIAGTGAVTISATGVWSIQGTIIRATSTTARVYTVVTIDNCTQKVFSTTANLTSLDWTATNILKVRATAGGGGGGNDDITAQMWKVVFQP